MPETLLQKAQRLGIKPASPKVGKVKETAADIKETFLGVGEQLFGAGEKIVETATEEDLTLGEKARGIGSVAFRGASRGFGEAIIGAGKIALPQRTEEAIAGKVTEIAGGIAQRPEIQSLVEKYNSLSPDTKREIDNALGFGEGLAEIATFGGLSALKRPLLKALEKTIEEASKKSKLSVETVKAATPNRVRNL